MSMRKRLCYAVTLAAFLIASASVSEARTWTVGKAGVPCGTADFNTIAAAVDAAQSGDTVEICPALYPEQLVITKPLTLTGIQQNSVNRVLIQPANLGPSGNLGFMAVIAVVNTSGVTISNLAIDAGNNHVTGCTPALAGTHFRDASAVVDGVSVSGAQLPNRSCTALYPGNGSGIQIDATRRPATPYRVTVRNSSIHDYSRNGILAVGDGVEVDISGNSIAGLGPAANENQFDIFLADGVTGQVVRNVLSQSSCGSTPILECFNLRSEGVVLRNVGSNLLVSDNVITNTQAGVFVNGASAPRVLNNTISNVDAISAIHIQGSTGGTYSGNRISHVGPITSDASVNEEGCGINAVSGTGNSKNTISDNWINDAYCGVAYVTGDTVARNFTLNTLYPQLNGDDYPVEFPPAVEPGQTPTKAPAAQLRRKVE